MTDLTMYTPEERRESVKDILNLGFVAQLEGGITNLPLIIIVQLTYNY